MFIKAVNTVSPQCRIPLTCFPSEDSTNVKRPHDCSCGAVANLARRVSASLPGSGAPCQRQTFEKGCVFSKSEKGSDKKRPLNAQITIKLRSHCPSQLVLMEPHQHYCARDLRRVASRLVIYSCLLLKWNDQCWCLVFDSCVKVPVLSLCHFEHAHNNHRSNHEMLLMSLQVNVQVN